MVVDVAFRVDHEVKGPAPPPLATEARKQTLLVAVESVAQLAPSLATYREPSDLRVTLDADTTLGAAELEMPLLVERSDNDTMTLSGTAYHLDIAIRARNGATELSWTLEPGGSDARSRLAVLNLLHVLHGEGVLVLRDPEYGDIGMLRLSATPPDAGIEAERGFYRAIVVVEEWSGYRFTLPDSVTKTDAHRIWQAALNIRARSLVVRFASDIQATIMATSDWRAADELRFDEPYSEQIFYTDVFLGRLDYRVRVRPISAQSVSDGMLRVTYRPATDLLKVPLEPPRPDSTQRVARIEAGEMPAIHPIDHPDATRLARARELLSEWRQEVPRNSDLRKRIQRQWPPR